MDVHIALVCSEESQTKQIVPCLEQQGWQVTIAETGAEALTQIEQILPLAAIIYASLSDITGWEVIEKIRQNPVTRDTGVILVAQANPLNKVLPQRIATGVDIDLREPVEPITFVSCLLRVIKAQQEEEFASPK